MAYGSPTETAVVEVKSPLLSKTNITGFLLVVLGVLGYLNVLPDSLAAAPAVDALVALGGTAVILFRSFAKSVLRRPTA